MKLLFALLTWCGLVLTSNGQIINYEIDPFFSVGSMYQKTSISCIATLNGSFIISGNVNNQNSPEGAITQISYSGEYILTVSDETVGPANVVEYKENLIQYGNRIDRFDLSGNGLGFEFEFARPPYSGFISEQAIIAFFTPEDNIIVGGIFFTDSTDISPNSLRQLCMIDSTGAPIPGFPMVKCEPVDARIHSIDSLSTGEYIIAGSFSPVNGHPTNNVAKLHADFSVDTSFVSVFGNQGGVVVGEIDSIDRIWIRISNGYLNSNPDSLVYFLRLLSNGDLDTSIQIPTFTSYYNATNPFETGPAAIALLEDNTILLGGNFVEVNGEYHKTMVQLYADGSIVEGTFENLGADEAVWDNWEPALGPIAGTYIRIIKKLPDGKLLLGGSFSSFGGEPRNCLVRLRPDGYVGVDEYEKPKVEMTIFPNPADGFVTVAYNLHQSKENTMLNIYDNIARNVYSIKLGEAYQGEKLIDTRKFTNGIYILEIRQDDFQIEVNKFVVTH